MAIGWEEWESIAVDATAFHENMAIGSLPSSGSVNRHADVPVVGSDLVWLPSGRDGLLSIAWHNNEREPTFRRPGPVMAALFHAFDVCIKRPDEEH